MVRLDRPFKLDKNGLWYLDTCDVYLTPFKFSEVGTSWKNNPHFFKIDGIDDYIVKDTTLYPFFFNRLKNLNLLKKLQNKQESLPNIDFPIGYVKDIKDGYKGIIIPYYKGATSLNDFIYLNRLKDLVNLYHHDDNDIDNLVTMFLEILSLIKTMYYNEIYYLDIHPGNFLIYNNSIKIVDFESEYIYFKDRDNWYFKRIISNYEVLINKICERMGFNEKIINSDSFMDLENNVKILRKELKR